MRKANAVLVRRLEGVLILLVSEQNWGLSMAYFSNVGRMNYEETLDVQICSLFVTEEYVYDAIKGLMGITLNFERHWCDAMVYEAVLMPLVDIIECRERAVEILGSFVKPANGNSIADVILSLPEN